MRFVYAAAALLAAVVSAQNLNNAIAVPEGSSTLTVTAGEPLVIDWSNPSSGTVTIKLQQDPIQPDGGITLASGIPASLGSATLQIPDAADVNSHLYTIEIIDDTNEANINFSPNFGIVGATGTAVATASTASVTGSTTTGSATTSSGSTESASTTESTSGSTRSATTTASSSISRTSSSSSSATSASETTSAPSSNDNGASGLKVQSGLFALAVAVVAAVI